MIFRHLILALVTISAPICGASGLLISAGGYDFIEEFQYLHGQPFFMDEFMFHAFKIELPEAAVVETITVQSVQISAPIVNVTFTVTKDDGNGLPDSGTVVLQELVQMNRLSGLVFRGPTNLALELEGGAYWVSMTVDALEAGNVWLPADSPNPLSEYAVWNQDTGGWVPVPNSEAFGVRVSGYFVSGLADSDGDVVFDNVDNCIVHSNDTQIDHDGDGFGNACDADFDNNCTVNFLDYFEMVSHYMETGPDIEYDLNNDEIVNFFDIARFKNLFFQAPGPSAIAELCLVP